jgi:hypothetical protein
VRRGLGEAFDGVGDQCHVANAAPLDGLSQELASEAPAAGRPGATKVQRDGEIHRHTVGALVGEADDCVVLLSTTTVAAPGVSNARIARSRSGPGR